MRDDLQFTKCVLYFYYTKVRKHFTDSTAAILPVSVWLIYKPVNRKISVNRFTANIPNMHSYDATSSRTDATEPRTLRYWNTH